MFDPTVKSIVGAGVLSLPYGVAAFGNNASALAPAIGLIALMGVLSGYTFGLIGRVCQNSNTMSYSDAWDATVGKKCSCISGGVEVCRGERLPGVDFNPVFRKRESWCNLLRRQNFDSS